MRTFTSSDVPVVDEQRWSDACHRDEGWCTRCLDFTTSPVAPQATDRCRRCGLVTVVGALRAMDEGLIEVRCDP